jgi:hypothetical protein
MKAAIEPTVGVKSGAYFNTRSRKGVGKYMSGRTTNIHIDSATKPMIAIFESDHSRIATSLP